MVEQYEVGRGYTKRQRIGAESSDLEGMRAMLDELASADHTVEGRLADLQRQVEEILTRAGLPLVARGEPYGNPEWCQRNEHKSLEWYAIHLLTAIKRLRQQIAAGDRRLLVDLALEIGVLAAEAKMIQYTTGNTSRGGRGFRNSDKRKDAVAQHAAWCAEADEHWREHPSWGARTIAKLINPKRAETVRKVIKGRRPISNSGSDAMPMTH
jgi:hypothetical protein